MCCLLVPYAVNVGADNTTTGDYPNAKNGDLGQAEWTAQHSDDDRLQPGVRVYSNGIDAHHDDVIGFADGIDKFGNGHDNACLPFEPLLINLPVFDQFPDATFVFRYAASDPDQMTRREGGFPPHYDLPPGGGVLRVWTKDGDKKRKPQSASQGGDFIQPDREYTVPQLGRQPGDTRIRLFMEIVDTEVFKVSLPITIEFYPFGLGYPPAASKERFKLTPYRFGTENPG